MYENLSSIKYGDVLVAEYPDISTNTHQRNYIIFIANGIISDSASNSRYKFANIGVIAAINLGGHFFGSMVEGEKRFSIGFITWSKNVYETSIIRKPKFSEMAEFITVMKANNFKFNRKTMIRVTDKHVFFWSGWPSNWHPSIFTAEYEGKEYKFHNAEQYFMFVKAKTFGDDEIAERIINEGKDSKVAKALGREVKNYDDKVWDEKRYEVMLEANYLKYTKCPKLQEALLGERYKGKGFCESSPVDRIWGAGIHTNDITDDESTWKGQNLLGKVLDEVRDRIIAENGESK